MIDHLRKKFIRICTLSFLAVFLVLFSAIYLITAWQTDSSLDMLADIVIENDGRFPEYEEFSADDAVLSLPDSVNQESPFTTRFFTVVFDADGQLESVDLGAIASVTSQQAASYAATVLQNAKERGWIDDFRYKVHQSDEGTVVVLISGTDAKHFNRRFLLSTSSVFAGGSLIVLLLIILFSKRAVRPSAESYDKQKQFITDASHELKTPLTLIRTNLDIMEEENGPNEWLSDIREETDSLTTLVDRLVTLTRMDENQSQPDVQPFSLSDAVEETASAFSAAAQKAEQKMIVNIVPDVHYTGNETDIRQLISIIMDNAVKYCDKNGTIRVTLTGGRHPVLTIDNSYAAVGDIALDRLFDRFYRADKARTYGGGFGIGLSIAKAITERYHGEITVSKADSSTIRFRIRF